MKRCGRDGPNLGFPALTHDHIAVQNWTQSTCSHLAVVLGRLPPVWLGKRGQTSLHPIGVRQLNRFETDASKNSGYRLLTVVTVVLGPAYGEHLLPTRPGWVCPGTCFQALEAVVPESAGTANNVQER